MGKRIVKNGDATPSHKSSGLSRRHLLAGLGLESLAFLTPSARAAEPLDGKTPDGIFDVIVAGLGAAGAAAALEAAEAGSTVLIVEKESAERHCPTTRLSSGIYLCPDKDTPADVLGHYIASTYIPNGSEAWKSGSMDPELAGSAGIWARLAPETFDWLHSLDPDFRPATSSVFSNLRFSTFWEGVRPHIQALIATYGKWQSFSSSTYGAPKKLKTSGEALYQCLRTGVDSHPRITTRFACAADSLVVDGERVAGLRVTHQGKSSVFLARRAVVIATGGFAFNREMREVLLPAAGNPYWGSSGSPANRGDGIAMALGIGAGLVRASMFFDRFCLLLPPEAGEVRKSVVLDCLGSPHSFVMDNFGRRFAPESDMQDREHHYGFYQTLLQFDQATMSFPRAPAWFVFDERLMRRGPLPMLGEGSTVNGLVPWSRDNLDAVRRGWILKASTPEALAAEIARHPDNAGRLEKAGFLETLARFNGFAEKGRDEDFDSDPASLGPVSEGPFYAMPVFIDVPHMAAGIRTDASRRVVRWDGTPVEGLLAAGEAAPVSRFVHDTGGHLSECLVFGRHAGRTAARLPKRMP